jgi:hypothetical protein
MRLGNVFPATLVELVLLILVSESMNWRMYCTVQCGSKVVEKIH